MLEGTLDEFSIPDIFQLLALTKKSGSLRVSGTTEGRVFFRQGEVYFALSDARRMPLGARLVGAGLVTDEHLQAALEADAGSSGASLGEVLVRDGGIDEAVLDAIVREQVQDAVFELMRLPSGTFKFDPAESAEPAAVGLTLDPGQLVLEGTRRLAEWQSFVDRIPSAESVLAVCTRPPDEEVRISASEWAVFALVDAQRTVADIVELSGQSEYACGLILAGLVERGLVEVHSDGADSGIAQLLRRREALRVLEARELGSAAPAPAPAPTPAQPVVAEFTLRNDEARANGNGNGNGRRPLIEERELAEDTPPRPTAKVSERVAAPQPVAEPAMAAAPAAAEEAPAEQRALRRDEDVNKGLLLRLIDGVKEA